MLPTQIVENTHIKMKVDALIKSIQEIKKFLNDNYPNLTLSNDEILKIMELKLLCEIKVRLSK